MINTCTTFSYLNVQLVSYKLEVNLYITSTPRVIGVGVISHDFKSCVGVSAAHGVVEPL